MNSLFKRLEWKHKNNKFLYYIRVLLRELVPTSIYRSKLLNKLSSTKYFDIDYIKQRVNYYNKLSTNSILSYDSIKLSELKIPSSQKVYYFDSYEYIRYFNPSLKAKFLFGDITHVPDEPSLLKSRPINTNNNNSVVLKLDKIRHFIYTKDSTVFADKKNILVGRAAVLQPHRIRFYEKYFNHPLCNLGQINKDQNHQWIKERLTISEHLQYKFILCIEGNDVASNLKWVMSSNSLAVMPKPKYETWYMEGTLIPNYHYIEIKEDYSNLEERLNYYIEHTNEAMQIIENANAYIRQFKNREQEDLISLLVLEKYFYRTGQMAALNPSLYE